MDPQLVDWGGSAVLLGIFWQAMAWSIRRLARRLDRQDEDLAELKTDMAVVKNDLSHIRPRMERMDTSILQIVRDLGQVEGGVSQTPPREKVAAGGS